ncbi:hypothetical protein GCM10022381_41890 [Leifsonia kafniensis]|uniref:Uncharacterized protein n=1 Tax=Leifsonia kafniensis TaxID=475957 RepID=A0ABP7LAK3_9MICO
MSLLTLKRYGRAERNAELAGLADSAGLSNVFNPSIAALDGTTHVAFRGESTPGARPFRAFYATSDGNGPSMVADLTEIASNYGIRNVADPKLVVLDARVYVTFNTGFSSREPNHLYLQQLWPRIEAPQECVVDARQIIEKNWAFYLDSKGELGAIYSLTPTVTIALREGELGSGSPLVFARRPATSAEECSALTIGTQLSFSGDGVAWLVAHQKLRVLRRRAYFGRLVRVQFSVNDDVQLDVGGRPLVHSLASTLPRLPRHNRGLLSATYFAGLQYGLEGFDLSYGINDVGYSFAHVRKEDLWP